VNCKGSVVELRTWAAESRDDGHSDRQLTRGSVVRSSGVNHRREGLARVHEWPPAYAVARLRCGHRCCQLAGFRQPVYESAKTPTGRVLSRHGVSCRAPKLPDSSASAADAIPLSEVAPRSGAASGRHPRRDGRARRGRTRSALARRSARRENRRAEADVDLRQAVGFHDSVRATHYIREGDVPLAASAWCPVTAR
jgi:hypothetical protein